MPERLSDVRLREIRDWFGRTLSLCDPECEGRCRECPRDVVAALLAEVERVRSPEVRALAERLRAARPSHSAACDEKPFHAACVCGFRETRDVLKQAADLLDAREGVRTP